MEKYRSIPKELNEIAAIIVHSAYVVHNSFGPGLLERVYEVCMDHELKKAGLFTQRQLTLPIYYDGIEFKEALRLDILVERKVIIEIKAVDLVNPVWEAQVLSYLKLTGKRLGFLINFNVSKIKDGIKRFVV